MDTMNVPADRLTVGTRPPSAPAVRSKASASSPAGARASRQQDRGLTVALLGPDGAGKSTLAAALSEASHSPVKLVYLGLWADSYLAHFRIAPWLGVILRPLVAWYGFLQGQFYRARGWIVIFDRYTYDAFTADDPGRYSLQRAYLWLIAHCCPAPDLVLVLDAPGELMLRRKSESTVQELDRARARYRALAHGLPNAWVIDSSRDLAVVVDDALGHIARTVAASHATTGRLRLPVPGHLVPPRLLPLRLAPLQGSLQHLAPPFVNPEVRTTVLFAASAEARSESGAGSSGSEGRSEPLSSRARHGPFVPAWRNVRHVGEIAWAWRMAESALRSNLADDLLGGARRGIVHRITMTESRVVLAFVGPARSRPTTVLKVARAAENVASLRRHAGNLAALRGDDRLGEWRRLLPSVVWQAEIDGRVVVAERVIAGPVASQTLRSRGDRGLILANSIRVVSELHRCTGTEAAVTPDIFKRWVETPAALILNTGAPAAGDELAALKRIVDQLRQWLVGRSVGMGWIHGDYWPGNILLSPSLEVAGVLDWDQAGPDEYFGHDLVHLLLYSRRIRSGSDVGVMVAEMLRQPGWSPEEQALLAAARPSLPLDADSIRSVLLLYWIRYVARLLQFRHHAASQKWLHRNVASVLQAPSPRSRW